MLSGDGNGRTYYIGVAGAGSDLGPLRFAASAEASLVREKSCHLAIGDMHAGDRIAGYLGLTPGPSGLPSTGGAANTAAPGIS